MALFCDFENVALGVRDAKYEKFDIKLVLERLLLKGSIVVKKAYCDWDRYKGFKAAMHEANFELIEIPHVRQSGKNSADIRLVVDALDLCYTKSHVDTFVIISGDSDFSPLVSKLRENAKQVIGVGVKQSTSDLLIANCDEFIFYDDLVRETRHSSARPEPREAQAPAPRRSPEEERRRREELDSRRTRAVTMAVETCDALIAERGDTGKIWASMLKDAIKRRQPGFNESYFGFKAFGNLLDEAQARGLLEVGRDEKSGTFVTRAGGQLKAEPVAIEPVATEEPSVEALPAEGRRPSRRNGRGGRKAAPAPELLPRSPPSRSSKLPRRPSLSPKLKPRPSPPSRTGAARGGAPPRPRRRRLPTSPRPLPSRCLKRRPPKPPLPHPRRPAAAGRRPTRSRKRPRPRCGGRGACRRCAQKAPQPAHEEDRREDRRLNPDAPSGASNGLFQLDPVGGSRS
jgi:uncharacterized protein (TIGR00288 family)